MNVPIKIKKLSDKAIIPTYGTPMSAGADIYALLDEEITINPGEAVMIHSGISMAIPEGYVGLIFARSSLAKNKGLAPSNKVGVIDSDYRGEIMTHLLNHSDTPATLAPGDRVAQMVIVPYIFGEFEEAESLDETQRGVGGYGSTGR